MNKITDIDILNKRILIRVDFNVPLMNGNVTDNFRIKSALPTIRYCLENNTSIVIMSHLGRPNGALDEEYSLYPVADELEKLLGLPIIFSDDCVSEDSISTSEGLKSGEVHLLENLRFHQGETDNDAGFSQQLARHGDIYVNDAFGTAHRAHASNVGILDFIPVSSSGFLLDGERNYLSDAIENPVKPFVVVLGGSKISGKIELIENMMEYASDIIIGGAMAFTFLKAQGFNTGGSLIDSDRLAIASELLNKAKSKNISIHLPKDVLASIEISETSSWRISDVDGLKNDEIGLDIGPESCIEFEQILADANTILWNGPLGVYEISNYVVGTQFIAKSILKFTEAGTTSIIGGGDTSAAISALNFNNGFTHISTGGGASLELLSGNYLPAFKALDDHG